MTNETKWISGQKTDGAWFMPALELKDTEWTTTKKTGAKIMYLGAIGSSYGGDIIGNDGKGNDIFASVSVYKKPHTDTVKSSRSNYRVS